MTPDLYTAIKDILNYRRPNSIQREAGITGFIGESHAERQRFHELEKAFTQQEPDKKTLVDTWVAMRDKALLLERERLAFMPATSMIQVRRYPGQCFAQHIRNVVLPPLVDDIKDKQVFFSNVYLKARSEFCQLTENNRAQAYMLPLDDMFPDIDAFWKEIGCCLAVDHLYIMVDFNNEENVAWQVIAVTRRRSMTPEFPMVSNAELVNREAKDVEQKDTGGIVLHVAPQMGVIEELPELDASFESELVSALYAGASTPHHCYPGAYTRVRRRVYSEQSPTRLQNDALNFIRAERGPCEVITVFLTTPSGVSDLLYTMGASTVFVINNEGIAYLWKKDWEKRKVSGVYVFGVQGSYHVYFTLAPITTEPKEAP